jgi:excisionase family DNA binding protein
MAQQRDILTVRQAAEFLAMSPYTIREMARRGDLPARKIGKEWRFLRQALIDWTRSGAVQSANDGLPAAGRSLQITPAPRRSGRRDISAEHDRYFAAE